MTDLLRFIEHGRDDANSTVIWLHGLGADGHDFEPIIGELGLPADHGIRFIFPHAPQIPVTINAGVVMPAWYDIYSTNISAQDDEVGIDRSSQQITQLVLRENQRGVPTSRIVIAGFSQGGAIALHMGLRYPESFAGIMALSTYLPLVEAFSREHSSRNLQMPVLMCHGKFDPVVPYTLGDDSRYFLEQAGYSVDWRSYPMQHSVCPEEISDIGQWLQDRLL